MIMLDTTWLIIGYAVLVFICILLWVLISLLQKQRAQLAQAQTQINTLTSNLSALCASVAGGNKRLNQLEQNSRTLQARQDQIETQGQNDGSYGEAIQMVRHGATASRLVEELGLGSNEANLIVMLHGMKETG
jgi:uncharacterized protein YlxW (UPF0749 family)